MPSTARFTRVTRCNVDRRMDRPDVASMLIQAEAQHNLPGELEIDALPEAGRTYMAKGSNSKRTVGSKYTAPNILAPPSSEAAAAHEADVKEVPAGKDEQQDDTDSGIRLTSGEVESDGAVVTADAETPAGDSEPAENGPSPAETQESPSQSGDAPKWYDPRRLFRRPDWAGGGPPAQSEPEVE